MRGKHEAANCCFHAAMTQGNRFFFFRLMCKLESTDLSLSVTEKFGPAQDYGYILIINRGVGGATLGWFFYPAAQTLRLSTCSYELVVFTLNGAEQLLELLELLCLLSEADKQLTGRPDSHS